jgi:hypothetical protein
MTAETIFMIVVVLAVTGAVGLVIYRRLPKKLNTEKFEAEWKKLQAYCKDKSTWKDAVTSADSLLAKALRRRKFKGSSTGERMVSAQRKFSNNDNVWYAHNMYKKIVNDPDYKLKEDEVKKALVGFRQALRDLGALPSNESK